MAEEPIDLKPEDFLPETDRRQPPKAKKGLSLFVVGIVLIVVGFLTPTFRVHFGNVPTNPTTAAERGAAAASFVDFVVISGAGVLLCVVDYRRRRRS